MVRYSPCPAYLFQTSTLSAAIYFEWDKEIKLQFLPCVVPAYALPEQMSKKVLKK
jgi:hypothetical protein